MSQTIQPNPRLGDITTKSLLAKADSTCPVDGTLVVFEVSRILYAAVLIGIASIHRLNHGDRSVRMAAFASYQPAAGWAL